MLSRAYFKEGGRQELETIFFGGGTPTLLSIPQWYKVAGAIYRHFSLSDTYEWTVEANPGSVDGSSFSTLLDIGVNRISFGAQTFNEVLLQAIGRLHTAADVTKSVYDASAAGFRRISLDLMLGLPDQTVQDVVDAIHEVLRLGITHVSAYGLKIEAGTPFAKWHREGLLTLPGEDLEVAMYETVRHQLQKYGFEHYEMSNFAKPFEEARHNLVYWRNLPYLAVGAGAHGYVYGERYENARSLLQYEQMIDSGKRPVTAVHRVQEREAMEDTMMLGLRLEEGVSMPEFERLHGISLLDVFAKQVESLLARGLLQKKQDRLVIPPRHYEVANVIFEEFISV